MEDKLSSGTKLKAKFYHTYFTNLKNKNKNIDWFEVEAIILPHRTKLKYWYPRIYWPLKSNASKHGVGCAMFIIFQFHHGFEFFL
jgi:hypothetical protein